VTRLYRSYIGILRHPDPQHQETNERTEINERTVQRISTTDQRISERQRIQLRLPVYGYSKLIILLLRFLRILRLYCIDILLHLYSTFYPLSRVVLPHHTSSLLKPLIDIG
jgi:hypothetical protein